MREGDGRLPRFSEESENIKTILDKMEENLVLHKRFHDAYDEVLQAIQHEAADTIIAVVAPTGAGKSSLAKSVKKEVQRHFQNKGLIAGQIPVAYLEAEASERHVFQWRTFYHQWLVCLEEPLTTSKVDLTASLKAKQAMAGAVGINIQRDDLGFLRNRIREALVERNTYLVEIDEANNIAAVGSKGSHAGQMHLLKTMANRMSCRIVMFGTAEMIPLLDQSAQLGRRVIEVSIAPYGTDQDDLKQFGSAAKSLFLRGPLPIAFSIAGKLLYLHQGSIGLVGVLAQWVRRAYAMALRAKSSELTIDHLERAQLPNRKIRLLSAEVAKCASYFEYAFVPPSGVRSSNKGRQNEKADGDTDNRQQNQKPKPGQRKPHRDRSGLPPEVRT